MALFNLARVTTTTTGTGTVTLGAAVTGFLTFANAGVPNGATVTYAIRSGDNSEIGRGVYTSAGTTLTRAQILRGTNGGSAINLSGTSEVAIVAAAEDMADYSIGYLTRNLTTASGTQAVTGVGFKPRVVLLLTGGHGGAGASFYALGMSNATNHYSASVLSGTAYAQNALATVVGSDASNYQSATIASMDADGFTVSWSKIGSPTITAGITYMALK